MLLVKMDKKIAMTGVEYTQAMILQRVYFSIDVEYGVTLMVC